MGQRLEIDSASGCHSVVLSSSPLFLIICFERCDSAVFVRYLVTITFAFQLSLNVATAIASGRIS